MTSDNNQEAVKAWIDKKTGRYYIDLRGAPAGAELIQINITPIESKEPVSPVAEEKPLVYDNTMLDKLPSDVINAAITIERWTAKNNMDDWELFSLASRKTVTRLNAKIKADAVEIASLKHELNRTLKAIDDIAIAINYKEWKENN